MPGRQSTAAPSVGKSRNKKSAKKAGKRSLNALAIAEQQHPQRAKHRQGRLGEIEQDSSKRKREASQEDSEQDDGRQRSKKPRAGGKDRFGRTIEGGSDSDGNEWVLGDVDMEDDSDLDSDEAMDASDEDRFEGFTFRGGSTPSLPRKPPRKPTEYSQEDDELHDIDLHEDLEEGNDAAVDDDDLGDEAVDLAAILDDGVSDAEKYEKITAASQKRREIRQSEIDDQTADSEISGEESVLSISEDEGGVEESSKLMSLQQLVSTINDQDLQHASRHKSGPDAQENTTPSEFGLNSRQKLTIADLLPTITDPKLKKSLKILADSDSKSSGKRTGIPKKLVVPLAKRQQDRLDRAAAYEKSKETLTRWIDTVKHNRRAEHLSFPLQNPEAIAAQGTQRLLPKSNSQPMTALESTIQNILQESGLASSNKKSEESQLQAFEELESKKLPIEDVQARRAELRQARELLFREEIRAKRINKIKSKSYRRVHRKERERGAQEDKDALATAGAIDSESEQERKDRRRAKERMGARHRESKWARGVKDSGRAMWDEDARTGVTEMARRGEELRKRMEGKDVVDDEDGSLSSDTDSEEGRAENYVEDGDQRSARKLSRRLEQVGDDSGGHGLREGDSRSSLASLKFMRTAEAHRKKLNDAEIENMRREIAGQETSSEEDVTDGPGRRTYGPTNHRSSRAEVARPEAENEFEERASDNEDHIALAASDDGGLKIVVDTNDTRGQSIPYERPSISRDYARKLSAPMNEPISETAENPWLSNGVRKTNNRDRKTQDVQAPAFIDALPEVFTKSDNSSSRTRSALKGPQIEREAEQGIITSIAKELDEVRDDDVEDDEENQVPFVLRNQDLIHRAFAGDEVVANFDEEKAEIVHDEDEKIIDMTLPGWGNWTGEGISKKEQKRNKGRLLKKEEGIPKERRKDAKLKRVIINEKRAKKNAKYLASNLPHPFENRQQYERSLRLPVGPEWTTKETFQSATKPRILIKQGIIAPMIKPII